MSGLKNANLFEKKQEFQIFVGFGKNITPFHEECGEKTGKKTFGYADLKAHMDTRIFI